MQINKLCLQGDLIAKVTVLSRRVQVWFHFILYKRQLGEKRLKILGKKSQFFYFLFRTPLAGQLLKYKTVSTRKNLISIKEVHLDEKHECFRQRSHYAGGIWKHSFIFTVRPTVHTTIKNPSGKRSFSKTLFKPEEFENAVFSFLFVFVDGKHFENGTFRNRWHHDNHAISLTKFSSNTNPKWPVIVAFLNSSGVLWTENIWCVFRVKPPFSNSSSVVWTGSQTNKNRHQVSVWKCKL